MAVEDGPAELGPLVFLSQPGPATAVVRSDLSGRRDMGGSPAGSGRPERRGRRVGEVPVVATGFVELEPLAYTLRSVVFPDAMAADKRVEFLKKLNDPGVGRLKGRDGYNKLEAIIRVGVVRKWNDERAASVNAGPVIPVGTVDLSVVDAVEPEVGLESEVSAASSADDALESGMDLGGGSCVGSSDEKGLGLEVELEVEGSTDPGAQDVLEMGIDDASGDDLAVTASGAVSVDEEALGSAPGGAALDASVVDDAGYRLHAGWGLGRVWREPSFFLSGAARRLRLEDLRAYVAAWGFSTSSKTRTVEDYCKCIARGLSKVTLQERAMPFRAPGEAVERGRARKSTVASGAVVSMPAQGGVAGARGSVAGILAAGADEALEAGFKLSVRVRVVPAMQDLARLKAVVERATGPVDIPDLCYSWLWFRRYILSVPLRCSDGMGRCHRIGESEGRPGWITRGEYPQELLELGPLDEGRLRFEEQVDWFRELVLGSAVIALRRHAGGELGIESRGRRKFADVRDALVGFVTPVTDEMADQLGRSGYTSILLDGKRSYVLYGPLALVQHGDSGAGLGPVQRGFDWVYSVGPQVLESTAIVNVKWVKLKAEKARPGERKVFANHEEVLVDYSASLTSRAGSAVADEEEDDGSGALMPAAAGEDCVGRKRRRVRGEFPSDEVGERTRASQWTLEELRARARELKRLMMGGASRVGAPSDVVARAQGGALAEEDGVGKRASEASLEGSGDSDGARLRRSYKVKRSAPSLG